MAVDSGKSKSGGLWICVKSWCMDSAVTEGHCYGNLMIKWRPFDSPREFSAIVLFAVYIPLKANSKLVMEILHTRISKKTAHTYQQSANPDGACIFAGDFSHSIIRIALPKFHQNVSCSTREDNTLDHVHTNIAEAYKATFFPFGSV